MILSCAYLYLNFIKKDLFSWILESFEVIEPAGDATADVCDFTACNGLIIAAKVDGKDYTIGQCQSSISEEASDYECFVNEESICPKTPSKSPEVFTSTKPCEDPRAPIPRNSWVSNPWYPIWSPTVFTHPYPIRVVQPVNAGSGCQNVFGNVVPCAG